MLTCARIGCDVEFALRGHGVTAKKFCSRGCMKNTVVRKHMQTDKGKATQKRHRLTDKRKVTRKRHQQSDKHKAAMKRYRQSGKYKAAMKRYHQSEKGKAVRKKHQQSEKGKETTKKYHHSDEGKAIKKEYRQSAVGKVNSLRAKQKRRALKLAVFVENVDVRVLVKQQDDRCSLCGDVFVGVRPNPLSVSLDHTIPLSRGGEHSYANCTAMHLGCNVKKGAKILAVA